MDDFSEKFDEEIDEPKAKASETETPTKPKRLANELITEDLAALEFVNLHSDVLRYCHSTGAWFQWNCNIWKRNETHIAFHWARELARNLAADADGNTRKAAGKRAFAGGVEIFSQRDPAVAVTIKYWDADPWLLGTPDGTVDLRTGKLRPANQKDGITKQTLVAPAEGDCPLWKKFLKEATGNNEGLIRFLQQWLGYCLTGSIREHALVFVSGPGGNGKGVFLNVVTKIIGDYATTAAMETLTVTRSERHPTEIAKLAGARIVTASETEQGAAWAEARIKTLTGGDRLNARFMRQDFFDFDPNFKLMIIGNFTPVLRNIDDAMRRRMNMVPFEYKPPVVDPELESKLMQEAPAILQWMIGGCLDWQENGLTRPEIVKATTAEYFSEQDLFGQWLEERCDVKLDADPIIWDVGSDLFVDWAEYAKKAGEEPGSRKAFANSMKRKGIEKHVGGHKNIRGFRGVRLKHPQTTAFGGGE